MRAPVTARLETTLVTSIKSILYIKTCMCINWMHIEIKYDTMHSRVVLEDFSRFLVSDRIDENRETGHYVPQN